jgi:hypothetical protein
MNKLDTPSHTSDCHSVDLAAQQPGTSVLHCHDSSPTIYLRFAEQILSEHDLALPEPEQLNLIVQSALAVQSLYFDACLHHPDTTELYEVFENFLVTCLTTIPEKENLCPSLKYD